MVAATILHHPLASIPPRDYAARPDRRDLSVNLVVQTREVIGNHKRR